MKGIYVLIFSIGKEVYVKIGGLGLKRFENGLYAYVGSAQNNLEKRIWRHIRKGKKKFWHIDYLLENEHVQVLGAFYKKTERAFECAFTNKLGEIGFPISGFGSSDCKCQSHLFKVNDYQLLSKLLSENAFEVMPVMREGWCVWVTGLPGSGKSVVSNLLIRLLAEMGIRAQLLSSDALRRVMTPNPKYTLEERDAVYTTLVYIASLLTKNGVNVVIDATGNLRRYRDNARAQISKFMETYLECPLEICIERESKRGETYFAPRKIYEKSFKGEAPTVPGVGQPYEEPLNPEVKVDAAKLPPEECAKKILMAIVEHYYRC